MEWLVAKEDPQGVNFELKREMDSVKIIKFNATGFTHGYSYDEWRPWNGNNYIKSYHDLLLPNGKIIMHQWPNAGMFRVGVLVFDKESNVKVRLSKGYPY